MSQLVPPRLTVGSSLRQKAALIEEKLAEEQFQKIVLELTDEVQRGGSEVGQQNVRPSVIRRLQAEELYVLVDSIIIISIHPFS